MDVKANAAATTSTMPTSATTRGPRQLTSLPIRMKSAAAARTAAASPISQTAGGR
jgi:hypothetical protein